MNQDFIIIINFNIMQRNFRLCKEVHVMTTITVYSITVNLRSYNRLRMQYTVLMFLWIRYLCGEYSCMPTNYGVNN